MKKIILQEEISITQKEIDEYIKYYEKQPEEYGMGICSEVLNKKGIINEIKKLSKIGKKLLLMRYNFEKWAKKEKPRFEKTKKLRKKLKKANLLFD